MPTGSASEADILATSLPVGDPARPLVKRALYCAMLAALFFECFAVVTTEVGSLRAHSPWQDDPYDAVVSSTMFFVPLVCGLCLVRLPLFRRDAPLPIQRLRDLLRAIWLTASLIGLTLAADWVSVALGADRAMWNRRTPALIAMLAAESALTAGAFIAIGLASLRPNLARPSHDRSRIDWLGDVMAVVVQASTHAGPLKEMASRITRWFQRTAVDGRLGLRCHPLLWAATASFAFGALLTAGAAQEEGFSPVLIVFLIVGTCGMFAFLVMGGGYLGVVRSAQPASGTRRRLIDAVTLACASAPVTIAFRDSLWWLIGTRAADARVLQLVVLLAFGSALVFLVVLGAKRSPVSIELPRLSG